MTADRLRVGLAGFSHETNTFSKRLVDMDVLYSSPLLIGRDIIAAHEEATSPASGFIEAATLDGDVELVPLIFASLLPMGLVSSEVFDVMVGAIITELTENGPWNAILLDLHGAGSSEAHEDMDGELLRRIRQTVGSNVTIGVTLDMHANVSSQMVREADIVNLYATNPHLDTKTRAKQSALLTFTTARGEIRPVSHLIQLPLAINILRQNTSEEPLRSLVGEVAAIEGTDGILSANLGLGYPYSDSLKMGSSVLVIDEHDRDRAASHAMRIATSVWKKRNELQGSAPTAIEAARSVRNDPGPTVLLDVGDNVGGGTEGDSTVLLRTLVESGATPVFGVLTDPTAAEECHSAGIGADVALSIGGYSGVTSDGPFHIQGTVARLSDGNFRQMGASHGGRPQQRVGRTAVIESPGIATVMVTSRPFMPFSIAPFKALDIELGSYRTIVAKGVIAPRAALSGIAVRFVVVDTPGPSAADLGGFCYVNRRRPMYPFELEASLDAAVQTTSIARKHESL